MAHAPFAPSSADRWTRCTASFGLSLMLPDPPESGYASEGTRLHDIAAGILKGELRGADIDPADLDFLQPYIRHAQGLMNNATGWHIEARLHHSALLFGTPDLLAWPYEGGLHIVDLKTGAGIMVEPEENAQLMTYAYMALANSLHHELSAELNRVVLTIVQPTDDTRPVKSWETTIGRIMSWGEEVERAIDTAMSGRGTAVPGEHCRWCKAKPNCPALRGLALEAIPLAVAGLSVEDLSYWLDKADLLEQMVDGLRAVGHAVASEGNVIPGWRLKPKRATRTWADEGAVLEIARRRKIKIWQDKLLSPAMAEKAHPNMPEELTKQIVAISSGYNLVRDSNPLPRIEKPAAEPGPFARVLANFEALKYRN
jgi:hypothetical protein